VGICPFRGVQPVLENSKNIKKRAKYLFILTVVLSFYASVESSSAILLRFQKYTIFGLPLHLDSQE
jgi:hypothetical protein